MWAEARYTLKLAADEFWSLTPRQYAALRKYHRYDVQHRELLNGMVCSTTANFSMCSPQKPLSPKDFMPSWSDSKPARNRKPTRKQIAQKIWAAFSPIAVTKEDK